MLSESEVLCQDVVYWGRSLEQNSVWCDQLQMKDKSIIRLLAKLLQLAKGDKNTRQALQTDPKSQPKLATAGSSQGKHYWTMERNFQRFSSGSAKKLRDGPLVCTQHLSNFARLDPWWRKQQRKNKKTYLAMRRICRQQSRQPRLISELYSWVWPLLQKKTGLASRWCICLTKGGLPKYPSFGSQNCCHLRDTQFSQSSCELWGMEDEQFSWFWWYFFSWSYHFVPSFYWMNI